MSQNIKNSIKQKISEDISPTKNLSGLHLKIVMGIAIVWTLFQLWYASPFPFWFNFGMFKGLPARAIHLGFALTLTFLIFPIARGKKINFYDILISLVALIICPLSISPWAIFGAGIRNLVKNNKIKAIIEYLLAFLLLVTAILIVIQK